MYVTGASRVNAERMDETEKQWLDRYRAGDREALGLLVERYRRPLFGFILKMTEGRGDAEDVFQEVWIRALRNLPRFRAENLLGWLFRIAHNVVIDEVRRRKALVDLDAGRGGEETDWTGRMPAEGLDPSAVAAGTDVGRRIRAAVDRLPAEQREVFWMRTEADLPFKTIAKIQRVSINTALARMHYAVRKLREELRGDYEALAG